MIQKMKDGKRAWALWIIGPDYFDGTQIKISPECYASLLCDRVTSMLGRDGYITEGLCRHDPSMNCFTVWIGLKDNEHTIDLNNELRTRGYMWDDFWGAVVRSHEKKRICEETADVN